MRTIGLFFTIAICIHSNTLLGNLDRCSNRVANRIRVALPSLPKGDVKSMASFIFSRQILSTLYHTVFTTDGNYRLNSHIIEGWKANSSNDTYTFTLKPNLTFSDGQPIQSDDLGVIFDPSIQSLYDNKKIKSIVNNVTIIDSRTIVVKLKIPYDKLPKLLSDSRTIVIRKEDIINSDPIYSGDFKICYRDEHVISVQRINYDLDDKLIHQIDFIAIREAPLNINKAKSLGIDIAVNINSKISKTNSKKYRVVQFLSPRVAVMVVNISDRMIRKSLVSCFNKRNFLNHPHLKGNITPTKTLIPLGFDNFSPSGNEKSEKCIPFSGKNKKAVSFLSFHNEQGGHKFIEDFVKKWSKYANLKIVADISSFDDFPVKTLKGNDYDVGFFAIGPTSPVADSIISLFVSQSHRKVISYTVPDIDYRYSLYLDGDESQISSIEQSIRDEYIAFPLGRYSYRYIIPKNWSGFRLASALTGIIDFSSIRVAR